MRGWIGTGVLVLGVGVLGWWARGNDAVEMQAAVTDAAKAVAAGAVHGVQTEVSGRDIRVSGIADGPEERDALVSALNGVKGRRVVVDDLTVLDRVSPFTLNVAKAEGGALSATGHVPTEAVRGDLSGLLGDSAAGVTLAAGAPAGWADLAKAGIAALGPMNRGEMALADGALSVRGVVNGPAERDAAKRLRMLAEAERIVCEEDLPILPICRYVTITMYDPAHFTGLSRHAMLDHRLQRLRSSPSTGPAAKRGPRRRPPPAAPAS